MLFWHQWSCRWCAYQTKEFVENSMTEQYMHRALEHHVQVHHICQYCGSVGMGGKGKKTHEEACKRKQERKQERKKIHEKACKRAHELKVARQAMLLICLAAKDTKEADKDTNPTPITTLTAEVLQGVFKHIC
jgi:hypothetical protein